MQIYPYPTMLQSARSIVNCFRNVLSCYYAPPALLIQPKCYQECTQIIRYHQEDIQPKRVPMNIICTFQNGKATKCSTLTATKSFSYLQVPIFEWCSEEKTFKCIKHGTSSYVGKVALHGGAKRRGILESILLKIAFSIKLTFISFDVANVTYPFIKLSHSILT